MKRRSADSHGSDVRPELERQALISARTLVDRMTVLYRELERTTDAPIAVHRALAAIGAEPGVPASRLAELLGIRRPAVSHVLKALAGRGWIERVRSDEDQRSVRVYATPAGQAILKVTSGKAVGTLQRSVRRLSEEELAGLAAGLAGVLRYLPEARRTPLRPRRSAGPGSPGAARLDSARHLPKER
jgi:DNA-binding MarR family transcriptional regulator